MTDTNPIRDEKLRKLEEIKKLGIDPYPHEFIKKNHCNEISPRAEALSEGESLETETLILAGRLMTKRPMGKAAFFNIQDQSGKNQCYIKLAEVSEEQQNLFPLLDIGDFIGVEGYVFKTRKGEATLRVTDLKILCKSLEPLPEKYHGLSDVETKYRRRYLDLVMSEDSRKLFEVRSMIIRSIRQFLDNKGFMEVETPVLQPIYGGASAYPFKTHHRALDIPLYLKISPELYLKRLIVGGFEKVYEIGKNFRNEGIDRSHNPEFTMLEYYESYTDYKDQMLQFEELISHLCEKVHGTTTITYQEKELDFTTPWERLSVYDSLKKYADLDVKQMSVSDLASEVTKVDPKYETKNKAHGQLVMELFDYYVEPKIWNPTFIIDHPKEISPLTKDHRTEKGLVERFEPVCAGMEIGNAYTELNDPVEQLARLKEQESQRLVDEEAQPMDDDFIKAIEVGMPPTGGVGIGVERIIMLLTDQSSIKDILLFPTMKPKS